MTDSLNALSDATRHLNDALLLARAARKDLALAGHEDRCDCAACYPTLKAIGLLSEAHHEAQRDAEDA